MTGMKEMNENAVELTRDCCAIPSAAGGERWGGIWERCCNCLEHKRTRGGFLLGRENKPAEEKKMYNQNLDFSSHFHFPSQCLHTVRLVIELLTGKLGCQHWLQDLSSLSLAALG